MGTWTGIIHGQDATMKFIPNGGWSMQVPALGWDDTAGLSYGYPEHDLSVIDIDTFYPVAKPFFHTKDADVLQITFFWYRDLYGVVSIFNRVK